MRLPERFLTVSVFGSCRVHEPMAWLRERSQLYINGGDLCAYMHDADDILQQLLIREGRRGLYFIFRLMKLLNKAKEKKMLQHLDFNKEHFK